MSAIPVKDTLRYLNESRTNPSGFAQYVKKEIDQFINNSTLPLYPGCDYSTNEGKKAWTEAYNFLLKQKPLPAYQLNEGLCLAAEDHAIDMAQTGIFGHNSSNGASFSDRITRRCGQAYGSSGQNLGSEFKVAGRNHALQTIMGLIIDDGVPDRGHRKNNYSTDFKYVGISSRVQNDKIVTVFDFHSTKLPTKNGGSNSNNIGVNVAYESKGKGKGKGNSFDFDNNDDDGWGHNGGFSGGSKGNHNFGGIFGGNFAGDLGGHHIIKGGHNGGHNGGNVGHGGSGARHVVSQATNTKTSTCNGVKKTVKVTKIKYSDGTEQEQTEETISHQN